jgi:molybdate transport system substrate-binding protein
MNKFRILPAISLLLLLPAVPRADVVAVAGGLLPCVTELAATYKENTGWAPELVGSSSGKLARQIEAGAPFGIYLSADFSWPIYLNSRGDFLEEIIPLASSPLVLWWLKAEKPALYIINSGIRIALADPDAAPFGSAAKNYLQEAGLWQELSIKKRLVITGTVLQSALAVKSGGAEAGFVSLSAVKKLKTGSYTLLPVPRLSHAGAIVKGRASPRLRDFWNYLRSEPAGKIWRDWGFEVTDN